jgi:hypothetical protein
MTKDDQAFIVQQFTQHLVANGGNKITEAVGTGLMAALTQIISSRLTPAMPPEAATEAPKEITP